MIPSSYGNIFRVAGPVTGGFPSQRPVTRSYDAFFGLRLNKRLSKKIDTPVIWYAIVLIVFAILFREQCVNSDNYFLRLQ